MTYVYAVLQRLTVVQVVALMALVTQLVWALMDAIAGDGLGVAISLSFAVLAASVLALSARRR